MGAHQKVLLDRLRRHAKGLLRPGLPFVLLLQAVVQRPRRVSKAVDEAARRAFVIAAVARGAGEIQPRHVDALPLRRQRGELSVGLKLRPDLRTV